MNPDIDSEAYAKLMTDTGTGMKGAQDTPFLTAKEAVVAAIEARASGRFSMVNVWIEGWGIVEFPQIEELRDLWVAKIED